VIIIDFRASYSIPKCFFESGLLIAVAPRYCSGATFTVAVAVLLLAESSGDGSAATF